MSPNIAILIIGVLSLYSYFLVRRAAHVQFNTIIPFLYRMHLPNVQELLTEEEHDIIHDKVNIFNLRILTCFIAAVLAIGLSLLFITLITLDGDARLLGYMISVLFAYLLANYDVNSKATGWINLVENDLLARIVVNTSEASGFDTLAEYFEAETDKMIQEVVDKWNELTTELNQVLIELGFDPKKDYQSTDEDLEEYFDIMDRADKIMSEKYTIDENDPKDSEEK